MTPYPWGQWETPYHIFWGQWVTPYPGGQWVIPYPLGQWVPPCILTASGDPPIPAALSLMGPCAPPPRPWMKAVGSPIAVGFKQEPREPLAVCRCPPPRGVTDSCGSNTGPNAPPPPNETPPHPTSPSLSPQSAPRPEDPPNGTLQPSAVS